MTCPLCGRRILDGGHTLTVHTGTDKQENLLFCADANGCRRTVFDRLDTLGWRPR